MNEFEPFIAKYSGYLLAGVDEVGRGPLAGDVVAAGVILDPARPIIGLADSKKLTEKRREALFIEIQQYALSWAIARAPAAVIDQSNIWLASLLAMICAVTGLSVQQGPVLAIRND